MDFAYTTELENLRQEVQAQRRPEQSGGAAQ